MSRCLTYNIAREYSLVCSGLSRFKRNVGAQFIAPSSQGDALAHGRNVADLLVASLPTHCVLLLRSQAVCKERIAPLHFFIQIKIDSPVVHLCD